VPEARRRIALNAVAAADQAGARFEPRLAHERLPFGAVGLRLSSVTGPDDGVCGFVAEDFPAEADSLLLRRSIQLNSPALRHPPANGPRQPVVDLDWQGR
jgi:hypothetical protein